MKILEERIKTYRSSGGSSKLTTYEGKVEVSDGTCCKASSRNLSSLIHARVTEEVRHNKRIRRLFRCIILE
jgi:hypothetical protein